MTREMAVEVLNGMVEGEKPWTIEDLSKCVALGWNYLGGGIDGLGLFLLETEEEAQRFINDAPVTREIDWLD